MKKCLYITLAYLSSVLTHSAYALEPRTSDELEQQMSPQNTENVIRASQWDEEAIDGTLWFIRDSMFDLLLLIAVGVFLFIWGRLLIARWNPEEFKKAMISLVHAWIGLFVVAAAYALVTFIAWIDIL